MATRNATKKSKVTMVSMRSLGEKWKSAGTKVRHNKAKSVNLQTDSSRNGNQARTSGGGLNQAYDTETKRFTRGTSSTASGRMAVEGETNSASAKTWTMTQKDDNGKTIRQSGRSQVADRSKRYYDRRVGYHQMYKSSAGQQLKAQMMSSGTTRSLGFTVG